jgi:hypothetical protein
MSAKQEWGSKAPPEEEDASKLHLGSDFEAAKGMMLAEVKLVMESKLAQDAQKGEETSTTRTKCVSRLLTHACACLASHRASGPASSRRHIAT